MSDNEPKKVEVSLDTRLEDYILEELGCIAEGISRPDWNEITLDGGEKGSVMIGVSQALFQIAEELGEIKRMMRDDRSD